MSTIALMAIVFGAMVFVLGLIPNVIATFTDELRNLRGDFLPDKRTDPPDPSDSAQVWLLVCGAGMMILGLYALLTS